VDYDEEIPRRKRDPLKSFRDPRAEREEHYKKIVRIEEENLQERLSSGKRRKRAPDGGR